MDKGRFFWIGLVAVLFLSAAIAVGVLGNGAGIDVSVRPTAAEMFGTHWSRNSFNHPVSVNITPNESLSCDITAGLSGGLTLFNASAPLTVEVNMSPAVMNYTLWHINSTSTRGKSKITYSFACNDSINVTSVESAFYIDILDIVNTSYNSTYFIDDYTHLIVNISRVASATDANVSAITVDVNGTSVPCGPTFLNSTVSVCSASSPVYFGVVGNDTQLGFDFENLTIAVSDAEGDYFNYTFKDLKVYPNPYIVLNDSSQSGGTGLSTNGNSGWLIKNQQGKLTVDVFKIGGSNAQIKVGADVNSTAQSFIQITNCTISALGSPSSSCDILLTSTKAAVDVLMDITAFGPGMNTTYYNYSISSYEQASLLVRNHSSENGTTLTEKNLGTKLAGSDEQVSFTVYINETNSGDADLKNITFDFTPFTNASESFIVRSSSYPLVKNGSVQAVSVSFMIPRNATPGGYSSTLTVGAFNSDNTQDIDIYMGVAPTVRCEVNGTYSIVSVGVGKDSSASTTTAIRVNNIGNTNLTKIQLSTSDWTRYYLSGTSTWSFTPEANWIGHDKDTAASGIKIDVYRDLGYAYSSSPVDKTVTVVCTDNYGNTTTGTTRGDNFVMRITVNSTATDDGGGDNNNNQQGNQISSSIPTSLTIALVDTSKYPKIQDVYQGSTAEFKVKICNGANTKMSKVEAGAIAAESVDNSWKTEKVTFTNVESAACPTGIIKVTVPSNAALGEHNFTLMAQRIGAVANKPKQKVSINVLKKPVVKKTAEKEDTKVLSDENKTEVSVTNNTLSIKLGKERSGNISAIIVIRDADRKIVYNYTETYYFENAVRSLSVDLPADLDGNYSFSVTVRDDTGTIVGEKTSTLAITPLSIGEGAAERSKWWVYGLYIAIIGALASFAGIWIYSGEMPLKDVVDKGREKVPKGMPQVRMPQGLPQVRMPKMPKIRKEKKEDSGHFYDSTPAAPKVDLAVQKNAEKEIALINKIQQLEAAARDAYQKGQHAKGRQLANQVKSLMAKLDEARSQ